jgi:hypothetical protein
MSDQQLQGYGNPQFKRLVKRFFTGPVVANSMFSDRNIDDELFREFMTAKRLLLEQRSMYTEPPDMRCTWMWIIATQLSLIPHICSMVQVYFTLVFSTAEVERGFNYHKIIKTKFRSRLTVMSMDSLIRGKMLAEPFDWNER